MFRDYLIRYNPRGAWELCRHDDDRSLHMIADYAEASAAEGACRRLCEGIGQEGYSAKLVIEDERGQVIATYTFGQVDPGEVGSTL